MFFCFTRLIVCYVNNTTNNNTHRIGPAGAQALATALTGNSTITKLFLSCVLKYVANIFFDDLF